MPLKFFSFFFVCNGGVPSWFGHGVFLEPGHSLPGYPMEWIPGPGARGRVVEPCLGGSAVILGFPADLASPGGAPSAPGAPPRHRHSSGATGGCPFAPTTLSRRAATRPFRDAAGGMAFPCTWRRWAQCGPYRLPRDGLRDGKQPKIKAASGFAQEKADGPVPVRCRGESAAPKRRALPAKSPPATPRGFPIRRGPVEPLGNRRGSPGGKPRR